MPKERAGAASAISETASEFGGALGMAVLGSVLNAAYRASVVIPSSISEGTGEKVKDSLGSAVEAATTLPAGQA